MSSPDVGTYVGIYARESKSPYQQAFHCLLERATWKHYLEKLDQTEFGCPFDSPPATVDIKFVVNAFGVSPHCT